MENAAEFTIHLTEPEGRLALDVYSPLRPDQWRLLHLSLHSRDGHYLRPDWNERDRDALSRAVLKLRHFMQFEALPGPCPYRSFPDLETADAMQPAQPAYEPLSAKEWEFLYLALRIHDGRTLRPEWEPTYRDELTHCLDKLRLHMLGKF